MDAPTECGHTTHLRDLESDTDDTEDYVEPLEEGDQLFEFDTEAYIRKVSFATELAAKANARRKEQTLEEMLPPHYLKY